MTTPVWYVYVLRCIDNSLYTGIATDLTRRVHEHNHSTRRAARYTRSRRPVRLVYSEPCASRSQALRLEYRIRRLGKAAKEKLVR